MKIQDLVDYTDDQKQIIELCKKHGVEITEFINPDIEVKIDNDIKKDLKLGLDIESLLILMNPNIRYTEKQKLRTRKYLCLDDNEYFRHNNNYGAQWGRYTDYYVDDSYKLFDNELSNEQRQFLERRCEGYKLTDEWIPIFKHITNIFPDMLRSVNKYFGNHYTSNRFEEKTKEIYFILQRITDEQKGIFIDGINSGKTDTYYLMREYQNSGRIDIMLDAKYTETQRRNILSIHKYRYRRTCHT